LGVNSAFEDVRILSDCLQQQASKGKEQHEDDEQNNPILPDALKAFSKTRAKDCKAVVTLSRAGDRPGQFGKMTFLIPLLMDAFFHKALPKVFTPPIPGLIHNDKYRFHQVAVRKRWERLGQVSILGAASILVARLVTAIVRAVAKACSMRVSTVSVGIVSTVAGLVLVRNHFLGAVSKT
jgi:hypothetical protein